MREDHGCVKLVTGMPDIAIKDGHMYFCIQSGGERVCKAYPIHLIAKINAEVARQLEEFRGERRVEVLRLRANGGHAAAPDW